jgi:hypothetical protein
MFSLLEQGTHGIGQVGRLADLDVLDAGQQRLRQGSPKQRMIVGNQDSARHGWSSERARVVRAMWARTMMP